MGTKTALALIISGMLALIIIVIRALRKAEKKQRKKSSAQRRSQNKSHRPMKISELETRKDLYYAAKRHLNSEQEQKFYYILNVIGRDKYDVVPKVRVADLIQVRGSQYEKDQDWWLAFRPLSQRHVDFVITKARTSKIVCAVELDSPDHQTDRVKKRDAFLDYVFKEAGIPLHRVMIQDYYDIDDIRRQIRLPD